MFILFNFNSIHRIYPQNTPFPWLRRSGLTLSRCKVYLFERHIPHGPGCHGAGNCFTLMRHTQTPSSHFSKDNHSLVQVVKGQVNHVHLDEIHNRIPCISPQKTLHRLSRDRLIMFTLMRSTQNPSYLSSKDIVPVVTGHVNYVYLDEIHAESLVSLLKRHYPGCHGTGKLSLP
jgi:hypothetical protein